MKKIKLGLWALAAVFFIIGVFVSTNAIAALFWHKTTATIVASGVSRTTHFIKTNNHLHTYSQYVVTAKYRYAFNGKQYVGDLYRIGEGNHVSGPYNSRADAERWLKSSEYTPGNSITIFLDPNDPSESVISNQIGWPVFVPFMLACLFLIMAVAIGRLEKRAKMAHPPSSPPA